MEASCANKKQEIKNVHGKNFLLQSETEAEERRDVDELQLVNGREGETRLREQYHCRFWKNQDLVFALELTRHGLFGASIVQWRKDIRIVGLERNVVSYYTLNIYVLVLNRPNFRTKNSKS